MFGHKSLTKLFLLGHGSMAYIYDSIIAEKNSRFQGNNSSIVKSLIDVKTDLLGVDSVVYNALMTTEGEIYLTETEISLFQDDAET